MKIILCVNTSFGKEARMTAKTLTRMGHNAHYHVSTDLWKDHRSEKSHESLHEFTNAYQIMHEHFEYIKSADAMLVLNYNKYGIPGYIGGGMLMDMGFAHVMRKPLYVLNPIPRLAYRDEIVLMNPKVLNGELSLLGRGSEVVQPQGASRGGRKAAGVRGTAKRVQTVDHQGEPNGFLMELLKEGRRTRAYLTAVIPGSFKGFHLHRVRETNYVAVRGIMQVILYARKGKRWVREEHTLDSAQGATLHIPTNVATGFASANNEEAWLVNFPEPSYDPELKGEQVEYTEAELRKGMVK